MEIALKKASFDYTNKAGYHGNIMIFKENQAAYNNIGKIVYYKKFMF